MLFATPLNNVNYYFNFETEYFRDWKSKQQWYIKQKTLLIDSSFIENLLIICTERLQILVCISKK